MKNGMRSLNAQVFGGVFWSVWLLVTASFAKAESDRVLELAAGSQNTCVIQEKAGLSCIGDNSYGQLSNNSVKFTNPRGLTVGYGHVCVIDEGQVWCWGRNDQGQSSDVPELLNPRAVSAGAGHTCALDDEGEKCWGSNEAGQTQVPQGLKNPRAISAGYNHTCALDDEGVKCWGLNE